MYPRSARRAMSAMTGLRSPVSAQEAVTDSFADDPEGDQMLFEEIRRMTRTLNTNPGGDNDQ